jgi:hypothetical protein
MTAWGRYKLINSAYHVPIRQVSLLLDNGNPESLPHFLSSHLISLRSSSQSPLSRKVNMAKWGILPKSVKTQPWLRVLFRDTEGASSKIRRIRVGICGEKKLRFVVDIGRILGRKGPRPCFWYVKQSHNEKKMPTAWSFQKNNLNLMYNDVWKLSI